MIMEHLKIVSKWHWLLWLLLSRDTKDVPVFWESLVALENRWAALHLSFAESGYTQNPNKYMLYSLAKLTHHSVPAEARISSNEAPWGTWLALIWLRLVRPGPGHAVGMQQARWKRWWRARYMKGRMRESGFVQLPHLTVLSRANEHTVGS